MKTTKTKAVPIRPAVNPTNPRELAPIQQLIADEISDLLVHGGHADSVWHLLRAAGCHTVWRWAANVYGPDEQREVDRFVREQSKAKLDGWKADLAAEWKRNRKAAPNAKVEPQTAAERIRGGFMDELCRRFESFLTAGTPEEHMILNEVLLTHESSSNVRDSFDELPLGMAMEDVLGKYAGEFLRVPHRFEKQVEQFIECLRVAKCKEVA